MAPRGIVADAVAAAFSVTLYGLTASPVTRLLGVTRPARTRPRWSGGLPWAVDLGRALKFPGLDVLMWAGLERQREAISRAGLELAPGELLAEATGRGVELEGVTAVLLLTGEDDFNALASTMLRGTPDGPVVYRIAAPRHNNGVVAPYADDAVLFGEPLIRIALSERHH